MPGTTDTITEPLAHISAESPTQDGTRSTATGSEYHTTQIEGNIFAAIAQDHCSAGTDECDLVPIGALTALEVTKLAAQLDPQAPRILHADIVPHKKRQLAEKKKRLCVQPWSLSQWVVRRGNPA